MHLKYVIDETWQLIMKKSTVEEKPTFDENVTKSVPIVVVVATTTPTNGYELKWWIYKRHRVSTLIKASTLCSDFWFMKWIHSSSSSSIRFDVRSPIFAFQITCDGGEWLWCGAFQPRINQCITHEANVMYLKRSNKETLKSWAVTLLQRNVRSVKWGWFVDLVCIFFYYVPRI